MLSQFNELKEILSQEEFTHEGAPKPTTEAAIEKTSDRKRKRGEIGLNQFPKVTFRIIDVSATGKPLAPREALPKWRNTLRFLVRDHLEITVSEWAKVDQDESEEFGTSYLQGLFYLRVQKT